ncbi:Hpt domain-containing protein [Mesobacterium sp. TK19101]|uniref:Hpt domain-containing protein n=2 Tax=Mesobacterium hydrothermale TaxID=3111907 RepID=A0ABU6HLI0_9RHOB|nr:Hpt domain-containing protein [Mesobacterium sp. TK19101]
MERIRLAFIEKLAGHALTFVRLCREIEAGQAPRDALREMQLLAHRMYGVAGSVGLPEVGETLRQIETKVQFGLRRNHDTQKILRTVRPHVVNLGRITQAYRYGPR